MASTPGLLTDWPWKPLGNFKYVILVPWVIKGTHSVLSKDEEERDLIYFLIFPFMLWRMLHNQIWITVSRYLSARGNSRIVDKSLEFDQVDRERNWDDQILLTALLSYIAIDIMPGASKLPIWRTNGVIITIILHSSAVEFLYYWLHRALHHHFLYSRYHSHHHSSIVTEPITSVIHPFGEHIAYFILFAIPLLTTVHTRTASMASAFGYINYIDFMNNLGHCNFELIPKWLFSIVPPLKYFMYTPSFHSLHHTQFRTNYSLFMPLYDYIYGTTDKSSDSLYQSSLKRGKESPNVVHLVHLTTPESIYHIQLGFASLASKPYETKWYLWLMTPVTFLSMMLTSNWGRTFVVERNHFDKLKLQTWAIPKYKIHYFQSSSIDRLIEEAILGADENNVEVLSLGLLNQSKEMNAYGKLYVRRHPALKTKVVDGSSLATAIVLNSIPTGTTQVLLRGKVTKVACAIVFALCQKGIQVSTPSEDQYYGKLIKSLINEKFASNLLLSNCCSQKVWLVGDGVTEEEQLKASEGTVFIPFSQFPPKQLRKDCVYHYTPAMSIPKSFGNVHSCENWLPRRVMSAWRIAGIVHALEAWNEHECGNNINDIFKNMNKVWEATLCHGFQPLNMCS